MRLGGWGRSSSLCQAFQHLAGFGLQNSKPPFERVARVPGDQFKHGAFPPRLRRQDLHRVSSPLGQRLLQEFAVFKIHRHVDLTGKILLVEIDLLEKRREELAGMKALEILPEELPPIEHAPAAQVKEIHRHQRTLLVESQHVCLLA